MKILHFYYSIDSSDGGVSTYMRLISNELKNCVELTIVSGISSDPYILSGVNYYWVKFSIVNFFSLWKKNLKILKEVNPDLVHINGIWRPECWLFQIAAQNMGIPVVLSTHGMLEPYILSKNWLKKKVALLIYQHQALMNIDFFHVTAKSELHQIRKLGYKQPAKIIGNGVDISEIVQKEDWNSKGQIRVLFLSRIHPKKGVEYLIDALSKLQAHSLRVIIAGEGELDYIESLKRRSRERGVSNSIDFIGSVHGKKKWELYASSDLFILPTYSENFGIVIIEALATGIPVITTKGAPWKDLEVYKCGYWIDLTVENLVTALETAVTNSSKLNKEMGLRGRNLVLKKYDIKLIGEKMIKFYKSIINQTI